MSCESVVIVTMLISIILVDLFLYDKGKPYSLCLVEAHGLLFISTVIVIFLVKGGKVKLKPLGSSSEAINVFSDKWDFNHVPSKLAELTRSKCSWGCFVESPVARQRPRRIVPPQCGV